MNDLKTEDLMHFAQMFSTYLNIAIELEGMKAENRERERQDSSPAYSHTHFRELIEEHTRLQSKALKDWGKIIHEIRKQEQQ